MGYYIQGPALGKANHIAEKYNGEVINIEEARQIASDPQSDLAVICVVNNGLFEAAGYMYAPNEFESFASPDGRKKTWMKMSKDVAKALSGCR